MQSTLSPFISVTFSWWKSASNELSLAIFSFLNKYNYVCVRNSRRGVAKGVVIEKKHEETVKRASCKTREVFLESDLYIYS